MGKRLIQIKIAIVMVMTLFMYNQCGNPYQSNPSELQFTDNSQSQIVSVLTSNGSVQAFEDSVHQITRARCVACHETQNPTHAHSDSKVAHDSVIDSFKVNFSNLPSSRIVAKIRDENHGCWSDCTSDSDEMLVAVEYWADKVAELEEQNNQNTDSSSTDGSSGTDSSGTTGTTGYSETASSEDIFEATLFPLLRQRCTGCHDNNNNNQNFPGHANSDPSFAHTVITDQLLVDFDNMPGSRLVTRLSQDMHQCWNNNCTTSANQMQAAIQAWSDGLDDSMPPPPVDTDAKVTTESDTLQNVLAGTNNNAVLNFNVSGLLETNQTVTFRVRVMVYDDYSYKFWEPELITPGVSVRVKNIKLRINGYYNPQNSAYTIVDRVASPGNYDLASHALVALMDQGASIDKVSFEFEVLEITD